MEPLWVVLVHWNQPGRLAVTLEAFRASTVPVRFIVADSDSDAWAVEELDELVDAADDVDLVRAGHNGGFGPTANRGLDFWLRQGSGRWVALAPHDALPDPATLAALLEAVETRPDAGLVSADVGDGESPVIDRYFGGISRAAEPGEGWETVDHPHGTLMLLSRPLLEQVGSFDERYSSYCEEADLGLRAAAAGFTIGLVRGARVRNPHLGGGMPVVDYLQIRNTLLLVREHFGRYPAFIRLLMVLGQTVKGLLRPAGRPPVFDARARCRAVLDHLRKRYGPPPDSWWIRPRQEQ